MSEVRSAFVDAPPTTRSAVANGSTLWIDSVDGRSREARRFRDVYGDLVGHLGGSDYATEPQKYLARRAAALVVWAEMAETTLAAGGELDVQSYTTSANTLRRLLQDIGLDRVQRDITPSLTEFTHTITRNAPQRPAGESNPPPGTPATPAKAAANVASSAPGGGGVFVDDEADE